MPVGASLHIGLNAVDPKQYSGWDGQLTACEFDANDMGALQQRREAAHRPDRQHIVGSKSQSR